MGTGACLCLTSEVTSWDLPMHPTPRRLQRRGAPEGHPTSAGPGAPRQQATPRLLQPSVKPPHGLCPQHYDHHESVSVGGPLAPCPQGRVPSPWASPKAEASTSFRFRPRPTPVPRAYLVPENFRERNLQLIQSIRDFLQSDEARFSKFKSYSGEFRQVRQAGVQGAGPATGAQAGAGRDWVWLWLAGRDLCSPVLQELPGPAGGELREDLQ